MTASTPPRAPAATPATSAAAAPTTPPATPTAAIGPGGQTPGPGRRIRPLRRGAGHVPWYELGFAPPRPRDVGEGWSLRRWSALVTFLAIALALAAIVGAGAAILTLGAARNDVVSRLDPAIRATLALGDALVDEETGVRGFALSANEDFLSPYTQGLTTETNAIQALTAALGDRYPAISADLERVRDAANTWRVQYAEPTIAAVRASHTARAVADVDRGKALFDVVRARLTRMSADLAPPQAQARARLRRAASTLNWTALAIGTALLVGAVALAIGIRRGVNRPLLAVAQDVRRVVSGEFTHPVGAVGPAEIARLGADVDAMRERILEELSVLRTTHATLEEQARDLERSNAELEQFAYVASHDLQEPLRKVASFCELIEARYNDKLDERGRQYIAFAVDGAVRMQALINDLLAFSRVGRLTNDHTDVDLNQVAAAALGNLAETIAEAGAEVTVGELPTVRGDATLLVAVVQNLIGNAVKFRCPDAPPRASLTARPDGDEWLFTFEDNGIGIDAEYAERIFVIFQRLHPKATYPGTGIGLAMCRKIIEYHGGRIWLDNEDRPDAGSQFRFTLPRANPEPETETETAAIETDTAEPGEVTPVTRYGSRP
jgi:signal transduction histidine kinase